MFAGETRDTHFFLHVDCIDKEEGSHASKFPELIILKPFIYIR